MHNFKPGQFYTNGTVNDKREILFVTKDGVLTRNCATQIEVYWNKNQIQSWVEVRTVKLYCGLYHNSKAQHSFVAYRDSQDHLDLFKKSIASNPAYELIREFIEEFNTV